MFVASVFISLLPTMQSSMVLSDTAEICYMSVFGKLVRKIVDLFLDVTQFQVKQKS